MAITVDPLLAGFLASEGALEDFTKKSQGCYDRLGMPNKVVRSIAGAFGWGEECRKWHYLNETYKQLKLKHYGI